MNIRRVRDQVPALVLSLVPVAVAAAWMPLRNDLPNTDVALLLVVAVAAVSTAGGTLSALVAPIAAVLAFDYFDTAPYGRLLIAQTRDEVTAAVLLAAGLVIGGMAAGRRRFRDDAIRGQGDFTVMASAARLVAVGEEGGVVAGALAGELIARLDLLDCRFDPTTPDGQRPYITREAGIAGVEPGQPVTELDLPVWAGDRAVAHYRLELKGGSVPSADRLQAAVGIAEQAGAALAGWPLRTAPGAKGRRLRLVR